MSAQAAFMKAFLLKNPDNAEKLRKMESLHTKGSLNSARNKSIRELAGLNPVPVIVKVPKAPINADAALMLKKSELLWVGEKIRSMIYQTAFDAVTIFEAKAAGVIPDLANNKTKRQLPLIRGAYDTKSWRDKSFAIFFYLHEEMGNGDAELTANLFRHNLSTFLSWIQEKKRFTQKWFSFVRNMKAKDVIDILPENLKSFFQELDDDSVVDLSQFEKYYEKDSTKFVTLGDAKSSGVSQQKFLCSTEKIKSVYYITQLAKTVGSGRGIKYKIQEEFVLQTIEEHWFSGDPISREQLYCLIRARFTKVKEELYANGDV
jgi:hypothetical protein